MEDLDEVSNNGAGYTGEIDRYEITAPADGRLQVSLYWEHDADFDLIVASDAAGNDRLAEGNETGHSEPEYVSVSVTAQQTLYIFVAGWEGDPGAYTIETIVLPTDAPVFELLSLPDLEDAWPANRPLTFTFSVELDPEQVVEDRLLFVCEGRFAEGTWCIDGYDLTFFPRLPNTPGDEGGLVRGGTHTLQLPRAARGLRAVSGEYLSDLVSVIFDVADEYAELGPAGPPRVEVVTPNPVLPWDGSAITFTLSKPVDPDDLFPQMLTVMPGGDEIPIAFVYTLDQQYLCDGSLEVRLTIAPDASPAPGSTVRVRLPGTVLALGAEPLPENGLTGPLPQAGGAGYIVDFASP